MAIWGFCSNVEVLLGVLGVSGFKYFFSIGRVVKVGWINLRGVGGGFIRCEWRSWNFF